MSLSVRNALKGFFDRASPKGEWEKCLRAFQGCLVSGNKLKDLPTEELLTILANEKQWLPALRLHALATTTATSTPTVHQKSLESLLSAFARQDSGASQASDGSLVVDAASEFPWRHALYILGELQVHANQAGVEFVGDDASTALRQEMVLSLGRLLRRSSPVNIQQRWAEMYGAVPDDAQEAARAVKELTNNAAETVLEDAVQSENLEQVVRGLTFVVESGEARWDRCLHIMSAAFGVRVLHHSDAAQRLVSAVLLGSAQWRQAAELLTTLKLPSEGAEAGSENGVSIAQADIDKWCTFFGSAGRSGLYPLLKAAVRHWNSLELDSMAPTLVEKLMMEFLTCLAQPSAAPRMPSEAGAAFSQIEGVHVQDLVASVVAKAQQLCPAVLVPPQRGLVMAMVALFNLPAHYRPEFVSSPTAPSPDGDRRTVLRPTTATIVCCRLMLEEFSSGRGVQAVLEALNVLARRGYPMRPTLHAHIRDWHVAVIEELTGNGSEELSYDVLLKRLDLVRLYLDTLQQHQLLSVSTAATLATTALFPLTKARTDSYRSPSIEALLLTAARHSPHRRVLDRIIARTTPFPWAAALCLVQCHENFFRQKQGENQVKKYFQEMVHMDPPKWDEALYFAQIKQHQSRDMEAPDTLSEPSQTAEGYADVEDPPAVRRIMDRIRQYVATQRWLDAVATYVDNRASFSKVEHFEPLATGVGRSRSLAKHVASRLDRARLKSQVLAKQILTLAQVRKDPELLPAALRLWPTPPSPTDLEYLYEKSTRILQSRPLATELFHKTGLYATDAAIAATAELKSSVELAQSVGDAVTAAQQYEAFRTKYEWVVVPLETLQRVLAVIGTKHLKNFEATYEQLVADAIRTDELRKNLDFTLRLIAQAKTPMQIQRLVEHCWLAKDLSHLLPVSVERLLFLKENIQSGRGIDVVGKELLRLCKDEPVQIQAVRKASLWLKYLIGDSPVKIWGTVVEQSQDVRRVLAPTAATILIHNVLATRQSPGDVLHQLLTDDLRSASDVAYAIAIFLLRSTGRRSNHIMRDICRAVMDAITAVFRVRPESSSSALRKPGTRRVENQLNRLSLWGPETLFTIAAIACTVGLDAEAVAFLDEILRPVLTVKVAESEGADYITTVLRLSKVEELTTVLQAVAAKKTPFTAYPVLIGMTLRLALVYNSMKKAKGANAIRAQLSATDVVKLAKAGNYEPSVIAALLHLDTQGNQLVEASMVASVAPKLLVKAMQQAPYGDVTKPLIDDALKLRRCLGEDALTIVDHMAEVAPHRWEDAIRLAFAMPTLPSKETTYTIKGQLLQRFGRFLPTAMVVALGAELHCLNQALYHASTAPTTLMFPLLLTDLENALPKTIWYKFRTIANNYTGGSMTIPTNASPAEKEVLLAYHAKTLAITVLVALVSSKLLTVSELAVAAEPELIYQHVGTWSSALSAFDSLHRTHTRRMMLARRVEAVHWEVALRMCLDPSGNIDGRILLFNATFVHSIWHSQGARQPAEKNHLWRKLGVPGTTVAPADLIPLKHIEFPRGQGQRTSARILASYGSPAILPATAKFMSVVPNVASIQERFAQLSPYCRDAAISALIDRLRQNSSKELALMVARLIHQYGLRLASDEVGYLVGVLWPEREDQHCRRAAIEVIEDWVCRPAFVEKRLPIFFKAISNGIRVELTEIVDRAIAVWKEVNGELRGKSMGEKSKSIAPASQFPLERLRKLYSGRSIPGAVQRLFVSADTDPPLSHLARCLRAVNLGHRSLAAATFPSLIALWKEAQLQPLEIVTRAIAFLNKWLETGADLAQCVDLGIKWSKGEALSMLSLSAKASDQLNVRGQEADTAHLMVPWLDAVIPLLGSLSPSDDEATTAWKSVRSILEGCIARFGINPFAVQIDKKFMTGDKCYNIMQAFLAEFQRFENATDSETNDWLVTQHRIFAQWCGLSKGSPGCSFVLRIVRHLFDIRRWPRSLPATTTVLLDAEVYMRGADLRSQPLFLYSMGQSPVGHSVQTFRSGKAMTVFDLGRFLSGRERGFEEPGCLVHPTLSLSQLQKELAARDENQASRRLHAVHLGRHLNNVIASRELDKLHPRVVIGFWKGVLGATTILPCVLQPLVLSIANLTMNPDIRLDVMAVLEEATFTLEPSMALPKVVITLLLDDPALHTEALLWAATRGFLRLHPLERAEVLAMITPSSLQAMIGMVHTSSLAMALWWARFLREKAKLYPALTDLKLAPIEDKLMAIAERCRDTNRLRQAFYYSTKVGFFRAAALAACAWLNTSKSVLSEKNFEKFEGLLSSMKASEANYAPYQMKLHLSIVNHLNACFIPNHSSSLVQRASSHTRSAVLLVKGRQVPEEDSGLEKMLLHAVQLALAGEAVLKEGDPRGNASHEKRSAAATDLLAYAIAELSLRYPKPDDPVVARAIITIEGSRHVTWETVIKCYSSLIGDNRNILAAKLGRYLHTLNGRRQYQEVVTIADMMPFWYRNDSFVRNSISHAMNALLPQRAGEALSFWSGQVAGESRSLKSFLDEQSSATLERAVHSLHSKIIGRQFIGDVVRQCLDEPLLLKTLHIPFETNSSTTAAHLLALVTGLKRGNLLPQLSGRTANVAVAEDMMVRTGHLVNPSLHVLVIKWLHDDTFYWFHVMDAFLLLLWTRSWSSFDLELVMCLEQWFASLKGPYASDLIRCLRLPSIASCVHQLPLGILTALYRFIAPQSLEVIGKVVEARGRLLDTATGGEAAALERFARDWMAINGRTAGTDNQKSRPYLLECIEKSRSMTTSTINSSWITSLAAIKCMRDRELLQTLQPREIDIVFKGLEQQRAPFTAAENVFLTLRHLQGEQSKWLSRPSIYESLVSILRSQKREEALRLADSTSSAVVDPAESKPSQRGPILSTL